MLSTGEAWNPTDLYKIDMPEALVEKGYYKHTDVEQSVLDAAERYQHDHTTAAHRLVQRKRKVEDFDPSDLLC